MSYEARMVSRKSIDGPLLPIDCTRKELWHLVDVEADVLVRGE
jgi:hypothetical protein